MLPLYVIFQVMLVTSVGFAFWKGGHPERLGAAMLVAMAVIQQAAYLVAPPRFEKFDPAGLTVDLMAFAGMTAIALYADRKWPLWTAALQLLACAAHLVRILSIKVEPLVYGTMKAAPTFAVICVLIIGTEMHRRRLRRHGADPSWVTSYPPPSWMRSMDRSSKS